MILGITNRNDYIKIIEIQFNLLSPTSLSTPFSNVFVSTDIISKLYIKRIDMTTKSTTIIPNSRPSNKLADEESFIVVNKLIQALV